MDRLTERWSDSVVKLKGCSNVYANVERKRAHIQNAIVRLAAYEDLGLMPDEIATIKHGLWIGEADGYADGELVYDVWHCSECGYSIDDGTDRKELLPKYCPNCGAKMDLEE